MSAKVLPFIPAKDQGKGFVLKEIERSADAGETVFTIITGADNLRISYCNINLHENLDRVIALLEKTKFQLLADWREGEL